MSAPGGGRRALLLVESNTSGTGRLFVRAARALGFRVGLLDTILTTLLTSGLTGSGPIPDGTVIPTDPISAIAAGNYNKMPVLAGNTAEEGKLFAPFLTLLGGPPGFKVGDAARFTMMANFNPDAAPTDL